MVPRSIGELLLPEAMTLIIQPLPMVDGTPNRVVRPNPIRTIRHPLSLEDSSIRECEATPALPHSIHPVPLVLALLAILHTPPIDLLTMPLTHIRRPILKALCWSHFNHEVLGVLGFLAVIELG